MKLKGKVLGIVGVAALGASLMSAGSAMAESSGEVDLSVHVSCVAQNVVTFEAGPFADYNPVTDSTTTTDDGAIKLGVDTGCYLGPWQVNVSASSFENEHGLPIFFANSLSLVDPHVTVSTFSGTNPFTGNDRAPQANPVTFNFPGDGSNPMLETSAATFWGWPVGYDNPAPFLTEAEYTGQLSFSDLQRAVLVGLGDHTYTATMTVDLVLGV